MRSKKIFTSFLIAAAISVTGIVSTATAQSDLETNIEFRSVGVSIGGYSPSFDYFERTFWDFGGGAAIGVESEVSIMPVLGFKAGLAYFSTSSSVTRGEFAAEETLKYTLIPFTIAPVARYDFQEFSVSFSPGIDFYHISSSYESSAGTQSTKGNTTGFNLTGGIERDFNVIAVELFGQYIFGSFNQELQFSPDMPVDTQTIDLNGFKAGISLKYLF